MHGKDRHNARKTGDRHLGRRLLVLLCGSLAAGCGSRAEVSGKVFYQGKPVPAAVVTFVYPDGAFSTHLKEDGSYKLSKIPTGKVKIAVTGPSPGPSARDSMVMKMKETMKSKMEKLSDEDRKKMPPALKAELENSAASGQRVPIPQRYSDPDKSGLEYTVIRGTQTHDIELK